MSNPIIVKNLEEVGDKVYMKPPEINLKCYKVPVRRLPIPRTWSGITYYYDNEENRNFVRMMREIYNVDVGARFVKLQEDK